MTATPPQYRQPPYDYGSDQYVTRSEQSAPPTPPPTSRRVKVAPAIRLRVARRELAEIEMQQALGLVLDRAGLRDRFDAALAEVTAERRTR